MSIISEMPRGNNVSLDEIERWADAFEKKVAVSKGKEKAMLKDMFSDYYQIAMYGNKEFKTLYQEFEERCKSGRQIAFQFADIVYFILASGAAGIIGGIAYDALKNVLGKIDIKEKYNVESIIRKEIYEKQLKAIYRDVDGKTEVDIIFVKKMKKSYKRMVGK